MWLFKIKLMDAGGAGAVRSPPLELCNDMKINTCGENSTGRTGLSCIAAAMRATLRATQCFFSLSELCFRSFLFAPGDEDEGRISRRRRREGKQRKKIPDRDFRKHLDIVHWWRIAWLSSHCRSRCLQSHYRPNPRLVWALLRVTMVIIMTPCTTVHDNYSPPLTETGLSLLNVSNAKLATIRQKVTWNNIHSALIKTKWQWWNDMA